MPIPRIPCEIISQVPLKIINKNNEDETNYFIKGANLTLELCKKENIKIALLKANSPSCSNKYVYDGNFTSNKILGLGAAAKLLQDNGINVYNEEEVYILLS